MPNSPLVPPEFFTETLSHLRALSQALNETTKSYQASHDEFCSTLIELLTVMEESDQSADQYLMRLLNRLACFTTGDGSLSPSLETDSSTRPGISLSCHSHFNFIADLTLDILNGYISNRKLV